MKNNHTFTASDGEIIRATSYGAADNDNPRCLVYVHGFKGFKDWGFVPYLGEYLAGRGFYVITFNFSHNGIGDNLLEFTELDRFAQNTFSREVRELTEIVAACQDGFFTPVTNPKIGLLGHSRGGGITLLTARRLPEITAAVTWSSVATLSRYSEQTKKTWRENGFIEVVNQRTGQIMRLNDTLLDDIERHGADTLNIDAQVKNLHKPLLIIHGEDDDGVPVEEARRIYGYANPETTELFLMPNTGHTFDARHPFGGTNDRLEMVLDKTVAFFENHM